MVNMFSKILIANRGEITCRIIRTCRRLGIATVAVYSEPEANALHVQMADEAHLLGSALPAESYLNIERVIEAAHRSSAEAIHPGYGFLSENPRFARACQQEGIQFIGPAAEVMERMGDKLLGRKLAEEAGLPLVPGTHVAIEDEEATARAKEIGFPLMVKAAEGGGGIGIRRVESPQEILKILDRVRFLAEAAFGSPRLYLERYIEDASHVEVQVLADTHGNAVHLLERDCSVQRRHQKVLEETPCVKIDAPLRSRMTEAALRLVRFIGYTNAGTVEFLVDNQGQFYFLEMNTRLQVEHPITEMVTGLDLVEQQLRVAAGEPLSFGQKEIDPKGHAIEARIYAERPSDLTPAPGVVRRVTEPKGRHIRVDSSLFPGHVVTPYYDPLLAKLIAWGEDRESALQRLSEALSAFVIEGVDTNIPVIQRVLLHPEFLQASYSGSFLERLLAEVASNGADKALAAAIAVAVALAREHQERQRPSPWRLQGRKELMRSRLNSGVPW